MDFLKKKPAAKPKEVGVSETTPSIEGKTDISDIPPHQGPPELKTKITKTEQTLDDLEVPLPSGKMPKLEMPEFPEIPEIPEAKKPEDIPHELPDIKEPMLIEKAPEPPAKKEEFIEIKPEKPKLEKPVKISIKEPKRNTIFVRSDAYHVLRQNLDNVKTSVKSSVDLKDRLDSLRKKEDSDLEAWKSALENMQRKMLFIDKLLFEKGDVHG